jgi:chromosome segregation ATPase
MPARISPQKESLIMTLFLRGVNEKEIAKEVRVSQSTVSTVVSRLKDDPPRISRDPTLSHLVDELRSLSVDLRNTGITVEQAKSACGTTEELKRLGISPAILPGVIEVYRKISPDDHSKEAFAKATIEMISLQQKYKETFEGVVSLLKSAHEELTRVSKQLEEGKHELDQIADKKKKAEDNLTRQLNDNKMALEHAAKASQAKQIFEKAGLDIEKAAAAGNLLNAFSDLAQSQGQDLKKATADLLKFLENARSLDQSLKEISIQIETSTKKRNALAEEVKSLTAEKSKLTLENSFLKEAIQNVLELREKHGIGVNEIVRMRSLAEKYGPPSAILKALDTYKSITDLQTQEAKLQGSVQQLTLTEASFSQNIKKIEDLLASIPTSTNESIGGIKSSVKSLSDQVQGLGVAVAKASADVADMKDRAIADGKELAKIESRVEAYKLTSKLIEFMRSGQGEEVDLIAVAVGFLDRLYKWTEDRPKYHTIREQIRTLKEEIERHLVLG